MHAPVHHSYSYDEYLTVEEDSNIRHEFLNGNMYAMAGGTPEHSALATAVAVALTNQLRGRPCRVHNSDLRVRVLATGLATYPDVAVVCGQVELDPQDHKKQTVTNPSVVCEVLSPTTEDYDRGEKLEHFKQLPSLRYAVLLSYDQRRIEVWTRGPAEWAAAFAGPTERIGLPELGVELDVDELYRDPLNPGGFLTQPRTTRRSR